MSSRYFILSFCAVAVSVHYSSHLFANPLDSQTINLYEVNDIYHSSDDVIALSRLKTLTILPADHSGNPANISMRSVSQGVAVLQDRVYFSPAPYSAPQLQLLPNLLQQQSVTVTPLSEMTVGGQGAFGVISYQSLAMLEQAQESKITVEGSTDSDMSAEMNWGVKQKEYGTILAVNYEKNKGEGDFFTGRDTDRTSTDILFKINASSLLGARNPQMTEFTYQFLDVDSYRSLLGVTGADWLKNPMMQYSASAEDQAIGRYHKYQLSHQVNLGNSQFITDFYYHSYAQQLSQVNQFNGLVIDRQSLAEIAAFDRQPWNSGAELAALEQNNDYSAFGAQTQSVNQYGEHQIIYSARYHTDKAEMRFAEQQSMWLPDRSIVKAASSSILAYTDDATALTSSVDSLLKWEGLQFKLGVTYEHVDVNREVHSAYTGLDAVDFSDSDWMPQLGVFYDAGNWRFSTDIRRAWTAASAGNLEQEAQVSLHYQVSMQYALEGFNANLKAYMQEFDNLHVDCNAYSLCADARLFTQENIPDVQTYGIEVSLGYLWNVEHLTFPLSLNYQYINSEYQTNTCTEIQGCVFAGDKMAWLPEQQLQFSAGMKYEAYEVNVNAFYQSERELSQFGAELTPIAGQLRVDLAASYQFDRHHRFYFRVENLLDESLVTTASNSGIRVENGRISYLGYQWRF
ncbi:TonB-dependent receptor [Shewanella sp. JNE10-2]|uniref:TonB-dependent receptor n=1 Tax=unclassified Shewanella TaxID=196818 RepID=UPI002006C29A|nr:MULTISPECIES: TonB-dependent receptor [unclassified Shewanella]MCK7629951.1 TonB-dependent receptor [Shewanella sp. JNE9-1]MCK7634680.1 TonB-dependent receptor [Shewanella sp. JNE17]MCK7645121.1 TonB-dependent receptor [Shewanella sp. JNE3-1]MCK7649905.1 TonB-dependent receptor [Shewanella sp. JNE8]MCK7653254.1 TonB-dependent receptor [Shewanella sp. JNE4-1]